MSEDPLKDCPECHKPELVRQISAVGFALKGTGWYVTDFRDKGNKSAKKSESEGDSGAKAETTTESSSTESKSSETKSTESTGKAAAASE